MIKTAPDIGHNADGRLRSFIDRVLRLKEDQDSLAADIRDVYAEAKGEGYDKTAMGNLVSHLRKVEKHGADKVDATETVFALYLDAYQRATGTPVATRAHTHEKITPAPRVQGADDGQRSIPSSDADGAKMEGVPSTIPERAGDQSEHLNVQSEQAVEKFEPPAFLVKEAKPLRPFCLKPDLCAGYGKNHCHECLKAAGKIEVSA